MRLRVLFIVMTLTTTILLSSCGGQTVSNPQPNGNANHVIPPVPHNLSGPGMPAAAPDDFELEGNGHQTSAVYTKFFADTVNAQSYGRWSVSDNSGYKTWGLSNTCFSSPKAWLMGGNYWNRSEDDLMANAFSIPDGTDGIRVTFYARWKIAADGDQCNLNWYDGASWNIVHSFAAGQNPDYPGWTKYYYEMPANNSGQAQDCDIDFKFLSSTSGTDWGFGVDSVAVYQRQLDAPTGIAASDGGGSTVVTWDAATDPLIPDAYDVYISDSEFGTYNFVISTPSPQTDTDENASGPQDTTIYWYKVKATKVGWPDSPFSNADSGWWML